MSAACKIISSDNHENTFEIANSLTILVQNSKKNLVLETNFLS